MSGSRGLRVIAGAVLSLVLAAWLGGGVGGCKASGAKTGGGGHASPAPGKITDYFSCRRNSDCVVEKQKDCCPCNAGGAQIAVRKDASDDYAAARAARCGGDLLCPQVYLCDESAAAVCQAGRCALTKALAPPR